MTGEKDFLNDLLLHKALMDIYPSARRVDQEKGTSEGLGAALREAGGAPAVPPGFARDQVAREVVTLVGNTKSLGRIAEERGCSSEDLRSEMLDVAARLRGEEPGLIEGAIKVAGRISPEYVRQCAIWEASSLPQRAAQVIEFPSEATSSRAQSTQRLVGSIVQYGLADSRERPPVDITQVAQGGETRYVLRVTEEWQTAGWRTRVVCPAAGSGLRWGFRLRFEPWDEMEVLEELGLSARTLGLLRLHHGEELWPRLLDVLLPCRYGHTDDAVLGRVVADGWYPRALPGTPVESRFWWLVATAPP